MTGFEQGEDSTEELTQPGDDTLATQDSEPDDGTDGTDGTTGGASDDTALDDTGSDTTEPEPFEGALLQFDGAPPSNVLFISMDTIRKDFIGRYSGAADSLTPTLDNLLEEGVALDNHRSCSNWTYPSMLCALTGLYNLDLGYVPTAGGSTPDISPIRDDGTMVSQRFGDAGYQTGFVSTNPFLSPSTGFNRVYDEMRYDENWRADEVVATGLELLSGFQESDEPWLLHVHLLDPHAPYDPPTGYYDGAPTMGEFDLRHEEGVMLVNQVYPNLGADQKADVADYAHRMYGGEVLYMDTQVGLLLDALQERGVLDDTLVVFWSDHGEQLFDRGFLEHGKQLHSEESDAIAGFWASNLLTYDAQMPTSHRDLVPTLLAAVGPIYDRHDGGRALNTATADEPLYALKLNGSETQQSLDLGDERLLYTWDGTLEYYDLAADPDELNDLYAPDNERVQVLWEMLSHDVWKMADYTSDAVPVQPAVQP